MQCSGPRRVDPTIRACMYVRTLGYLFQLLVLCTINLVLSKIIIHATKSISGM